MDHLKQIRKVEKLNVKPEKSSQSCILLAVKLYQIPLSNDAIGNRIEDMSKDILAQVVADLIQARRQSAFNTTRLQTFPI